MIAKIVGDRCTGCSSCKNICPVNAIDLIPDEKGFGYPVVDDKRCVNCKKCVTHCPAVTPLKQENSPLPDVFAGWNKNEEIRLKSTSGGVYSALAEAIIKQGGYVVGAEYNGEFLIHHTLIHSMEAISRQRQSKYAQSDLNDVFRKVQELLRQGELVLFCGTPCQSAGLQKYLGQKFENLFCCDFICRGVISPKVYRKFLADMHEDTKKTLQQVHFKNKDYGWNRFSTKLSFSDGSVYQKDRDEDYYMRGYLKHNLYLRACCHQCMYKTLPRVSDISLGDFWGIGKFDPSLDNEMGTSVILVNSDKGRILLKWAQNYLELYERALAEVTAGNACLLKAAEEGKYRDFFFKNMDKYNFAELITLIDRKQARVGFSDWMLQKLSAVKRRITGEGR